MLDSLESIKQLTASYGTKFDSVFGCDSVDWAKVAEDHPDVCGVYLSKAMAKLPHCHSAEYAEASRATFVVFGWDVPCIALWDKTAVIELC